MIVIPNLIVGGHVQNNDIMHVKVETMVQRMLSG